MDSDMMEPIAIIGMAARMSGEATSVEKLWQMLINGRTGHGDVPKNRFDAGAWHHPHHERKGAIHTKSGFFLEESPAIFDAPFFSITAKEAAGMDPMQRKLLEVSYESFENAGLSIASLSASSTSVYTGVMTNDYELLSSSDIYDLPHHAASGISRAMLSNRISWFYNLTGPSLTLDTACSSSLYAFHLACQSLRTKESKQALVMGSNLILHPNFISQLSSMHMLSPDGVSHSFDSRANGYGRGEAIAGIVLKPLSAALEDGDTIRAVVRGSGVNQDGKTPGITMPSGQAQSNLILATYAAAGLELDSTMYFESHGTGTSIGDPIELGAIGQSFGSNRSNQVPALHVGSIKPNVGHTEGSAGIAGVIKTVLALERGLIPPTANLETINPRLKLEEWKIHLPQELTPWPTTGLRRASINSFGFGGSNAHVILDDAAHYLRERHLCGNHNTLPGTSDQDSDSGFSTSSGEAQQAQSPKKLLVFSSQDQNGIKRVAETLEGFLKHTSKGQDYLENLAYTLGSRRTMFDFRTYGVCSSLDDFAAGSLKLPKAVRALRNNNVALIFTGQGAQWPAMARELLLNPVFNDSIRRGQRCLDSLGCKWNIVDMLSDAENRDIDIPEYCQPVCTALQLALVDLVKHWGIQPKATVGHSSGEIGAAYAAGGISHESAIKIAYFRGIFVDEIQKRLADRKGTMLAAGLTEPEAVEFLSKVTNGVAVVGCVNSPTSVTLSGDVQAIDELETLIKSDGKFARKLRVNVAYHSPHMQVVAQDFLSSLGDVETNQFFEAPMFSSVTTEIVDSPSQLNAAYWVRNMVSTVRFSSAVKKLMKHSTPVDRGRVRPIEWSAFIELGPHDTLKGPVTQIIKSMDPKQAKSLTYVSLVRRGQDASHTSLEAVGLLWSTGHPVDISRVNNVQERNTMVLTDIPSYPWQHSKSFWHEPSSTSSALRRKDPRDDLLGVQVDGFNDQEPHWRNILSMIENPWIEDHAITGTILYPAAGMLIMVLEAALKMSNASSDNTVLGVNFQDIKFERGLVIPIDEGVETSLSITPHDSREGWYHWTVFSLPRGGVWIKHSHGLFSIASTLGSQSSNQGSQKEAFLDIKKRATRSIEPTVFYSQLQSIGMNYGPLFSNVIEAAAIPGENTGWATIQIPDTQSVMPGNYEYPHVIHPATLDAIFHLIFIALYEGKSMTAAAVPVSIDDMFVSATMVSGANAKFTGHAHSFKTSLREAVGNMTVSDETWSGTKISVRGMTVREVTSDDTATRSTRQVMHTPRRTGNIVWMEDVDSMFSKRAQSLWEAEALESTNAGIDGVVAQISRLCHKYTNLRVLIAGLPEFITKTGALTQFMPNSSNGSGFRKCCVLLDSKTQESHDTTEFQFDNTFVSYHSLDVESSSIEIPEAPFDLIIASSHASSLVSSATSSLLRPHGYSLIIDDNGVDVKSKSTTLEKHDENDTVPSIFMKSQSAQLQIHRPLPSSSNLGNMSDSTELYILDRADISHAQLQRRANLAAKLEDAGFKVSILYFLEELDFAGKTIISLLEIENPVVNGWDERTMEQFKRLVFDARYLLWLTRGGILDEGEPSLQFSATTGLLRTTRTELSQIVLPHLDISPGTDLDTVETWDIVIEVLNLTLNPSTQGALDGIENEFVEKQGRIYIPRVVTDSDMDRELEVYSDHVVAIDGNLHQNGRPLILEFGVPDILSSLRWVHDKLAEDLDVEDVVIQVTNTTLFASDVAADISSGSGLSSMRTASGVVVKVGREVSKFCLGDLVLILAPSTFRTHIKQQQRMVYKIPEYVGLKGAADSIEPYLGAVRATIQVARVSVGEIVLIDGSDQRMIEAMIGIQQHRGAKILVATADALFIAFLKKSYGLLEDSFVDPYDDDLAVTISQCLKGEKLDVVARCGPGMPFRKLMSSLSSNVRVVHIGTSPNQNDLQEVAKQPNMTLGAVDITGLNEATRRDLLDHIMELFRQHAIRPLSNGVSYSVSQLQDILGRFQTKAQQTPVTVNFDEAAIVPVLAERPQPLQLKSSATYVLAGGLGALGLTIAQEMVNSGARHLVFLSRSGATQERQLSILKSLEEQGCRVDSVKCDVTKESDMKDLMDRARVEQWSIAGMLQCAMVLRDAILQNMTIDKWQTATQPKIVGSMNLHKYLPRDLDFFIILSSMSGIIGNTAQANYAAGNTFEDALALYRRKLGLAATTLNVGLVTDASHFNSISTIEDYLKKFGHWASATVTDHEMQITIASAMRGQTASGKTTAAQILVGITDRVPRDGQTAWAADAKFNHRVELPQSGPSSEKTTAELISSATSAAEVVAYIEGALRSNVALAMTADPEDIDASQPLYSFGVDSLKAIEVRNWIFRELKCDVSVFTLLSPTPVAKLAAIIARKSSLVSAHWEKDLIAEE